MARSYRELLVWQKAKALAVQTYNATANFPKTETYGLTSQIRRASVSVASNIAEGQGRLTPGEFQHFLGQARGSLLEAETQLAIALDLGFLARKHTKPMDRESYQSTGFARSPDQFPPSEAARCETLKKLQAKLEPVRLCL